MNSLTLNRLRVVRDQVPAYDELFHKGLNIIRGHNGSGKSTICDFIYFALGADVVSWKTEASLCDYVIAELELNGVVLTIKRNITANSRQPMEIFWGEMNAGLEAGPDKWQVFSFQRSTNKESFSQILFRCLEIPEVAMEGATGLTMHQLLRVLYVDQLSPTDTLMRPEDFDSMITREAIIKTLVGSYDPSIYAAERELKDRQRELEKFRAELESLKVILAENGTDLSVEVSRKKSSELSSQLERIEATLSQLSAARVEASSTEAFTKLSSDIADRRRKLLLERERLNFVDLDIEDSKNFISELESRLAATADSIKLRKFWGQLPLEFCPVCLSRLDPVDDAHTCHLCKSKIDEADLLSNALQLQNELAFQVRESKNIISRRTETRSEVVLSIKTLQAEVYELQRRIDTEVTLVSQSADMARDRLLVQKGTIESQLFFLNKELELLQKYIELDRKIALQKEDAEDLRRSIELRRAALLRSYTDSLAKAEEFTLGLLKDDLPREEAFQRGKSVRLDFESRNTFSLDGVNNFSASSMVYFKNSILFSLFFASLIRPEMNYPRFILCDNIEDKGMEPDRSKNFQIRIERLSYQYRETTHQIIISTSMISEQLDNSAYCVGDFYTKENKSLRNLTSRST